MSSQLGAVDDEIQDAVRQLRQSEMDVETAALNAETRKLSNPGGTSVSCNLTSYGRKTLDLAEGDEVTVATFPSCLVIVPEAGGGDDE